MNKITVIPNKVRTNSNQVGIVFLYVTMTNDLDLDYSQMKINDEPQRHQSLYEPSPYSLKNIIQASDAEGASVSLPTVASDEDLIVDFAQKLYASSQDIDPEISKAATKIFWDIL